MLIDWFTVGAQIVNFLILVYLLKRFLYGPIIRAMDERERKIASRLEQAQKQREATEQERDLYERKNKELDGQRDALVSEMKWKVEETRNAMMREVRTQVEGVRTNWYEALEREKEAFLQDLRKRAGQLAYAVARRALNELANVELEGHIVRVFEDRLKHLDGKEGNMLKEAIRQSEGKAFLRSAFPMSQNTVQGIAGFLESLKVGPVDLALEITTDTICGIELTVHGHKIAWSLADYLESLETMVSQVFETGQTSNGAQALSKERTQTEKHP